MISGLPGNEARWTIEQQKAREVDDARLAGLADGPWEERGPIGLEHLGALVDRATHPPFDDRLPVLPAADGRIGEGRDPRDRRRVGGDLRPVRPLIASGGARGEAALARRQGGAPPRRPDRRPWMRGLFGGARCAGGRPDGRPAPPST